jgi:hypothetical protein
VTREADTLSHSLAILPEASKSSEALTSPEALLQEAVLDLAYLRRTSTLEIDALRARLAEATLLLAELSRSSLGRRVEAFLEAELVRDRRRT